MGRRVQEGDFDFFSEEIPQSALDLPVPLEGRSYCGDLDIRIDQGGVWYYNGTPIGRKEMVCLFASILVRAEDGVYWLISPTEMGRIEVEDAPFIATQIFTHGDGEDQIISFCTNVDKLITISEDVPIMMKPSPVTGAITPYVMMPGAIEARIERAVYYDLVERGTAMDLDDEEIFGVWSSGSFFPLGSLQDSDA
jgi:hypothetical protein